MKRAFNLRRGAALSAPRPHRLCSVLPAVPPASDADDQTGAVQRPRAARAELGALPAQVPPQKPHQAQGAQEEERQEGVHALPALAARQQGMLGSLFNCACACFCVSPFMSSQN